MGRLSSEAVGASSEQDNNLFFDCSTGFSSGISIVRSSGTTRSWQTGRHMPPKKYRKRMSKSVTSTGLSDDQVGCEGESGF